MQWSREKSLALAGSGTPTTHPDKGWPCSLGLSVRLTIPRSKNEFVMKYHKITWANSLDKRSKLSKMDTRFCTWMSKMDLRKIGWAGMG
jgi:hypothetical protein